MRRPIRTRLRTSYLDFDTSRNSVKMSGVSCREVLRIVSTETPQYRLTVSISTFLPVRRSGERYHVIAVCLNVWRRTFFVLSFVARPAFSTTVSQPSWTRRTRLPVNSITEWLEIPAARRLFTSHLLSGSNPLGRRGGSSAVDGLQAGRVRQRRHMCRHVDRSMVGPDGSRQPRNQDPCRFIRVKPESCASRRT